MVTIDYNVFKTSFTHLRAVKRDELWVRAVNDNTLEFYIPGEPASLAVNVHAKIESELEPFAIQFSILDNWSKSDLDSIVTIETSASKVRFKSGLAELELPSLKQGMVFPTLIDPIAEIDGKLLREALPRVRQAMTNDVAHPSLAGICLKSSDGFLYITATDSHRLHQEVLPFTDEINLLIPGEAAGILERLLNRDETVKIGKSGHVLTFYQTYFRITCMTIEAGYPNIAPLFVQVDPIIIKVDPRILRSRLLQVGAIAFADNKNFPRVKLSMKERTLFMGADCTIGRSETQMNVEVKGEMPDIIINPHYLLEALDGFDLNEPLELYLTAALKPIIVKGSGTFRAIVMPLH